MLARANRLVRADEFRSTTRRGKKCAAPECLSYVVHTADGSPARFGFIVSKSVGNAVVRNRVRRRMRAAAYDLVSSGVSGCDLVLRALPPSVDASVSVFHSRLSQVVSR